MQNTSRIPSTVPEFPSFEEFQNDYTLEFGKSNPELMDKPFWYFAAKHPRFSAWRIGCTYAKYGFDLNFVQRPIYTHDRFGIASVELPNGDLIQIAGEHEDSYDPNFCVYNDIVVIPKDGEMKIFGYPEEVFQPSDNHSATYVPSHNAIYIVGGYQKTRKVEDTLVYKLDLCTFGIEGVETMGSKPGWISRHDCRLSADEKELVVMGGKVERRVEGRQKFCDNEESYGLDLQTFEWRRISDN